MGSATFSPLVHIADAIKSSTTILDDYLAAHGNSSPSLGVDGTPIYVPPHEMDVLAARDTILSATRELRNLVLGPLGILMNIGVSETFTSVGLFPVGLSRITPGPQAPSSVSNAG